MMRLYALAATSYRFVVEVTTHTTIHDCMYVLVCKRPKVRLSKSKS